MLDQIREYLRIDEGEDLTLNLLLNSAKQMLLSAGVKEPVAIDLPEIIQTDSTGSYKVNPNNQIDMYELLVCMIVTHWYENRMIVTSSSAGGQNAPLPYGAQSMILQLKAIQLVPEEVSPYE